MRTAKLLGQSVHHVPELYVTIGLIRAYSERMIKKLQPTICSTECLVVVLAKNHKLSPFWGQKRK